MRFRKRWCCCRCCPAIRFACLIGDAGCDVCIVSKQNAIKFVLPRCLWLLQFFPPSVCCFLSYVLWHFAILLPTFCPPPRTKTTFLAYFLWFFIFYRFPFVVSTHTLNFCFSLLHAYPSQNLKHIFTCLGFLYYEFFAFSLSTFLLALFA